MMNRPALAREARIVLTGLVALFVTTGAWWALAFWPVQDGPVWLERTRFVCFGVTESGLPDAGGWIGLVLGPLGMLAILLTGWNSGVRGLLRRTRSSRPVAATFTALAMGVILMATSAAVLVQQARAEPAWLQQEDALPPETYPRLDRDAPPLVLTAQDGTVFDVAALRGRPVLVTFAYAHCSTICPVIVMHALKAQEALRGTAHEPAVVVVTLDPWRDPPSRLEGMGRSWGFPPDNAWILSGSVDEVEATLDGWEVARSRDERTGEVTHPSLLYVLDRDGTIAYASTGGIDALVSLVERLGP
jgi:protein SCO1